jgi:hypothetical protein
MNSFKDKHYDLTELNYTKLGNVAKIIVECIKENNNTKYTRKEIKNLFLPI